MSQSRLQRFVENVVDQVYQQSVLNLINSLIRRSLLEKTDGLFFLQPVVIDSVGWLFRIADKSPACQCTVIYNPIFRDNELQLLIQDNLTFHIP